MSNNKQFKIGDKVKVLKTNGLKYVVKNNVYTISAKHPYSTACWLLHLPKARMHSLYDGTNPGWWFNEYDLVLVIEKGQQLLFDFMYEE